MLTESIYYSPTLGEINRSQYLRIGRVLDQNGLGSTQLKFSYCMGDIMYASDLEQIEDAITAFRSDPQLEPSGYTWKRWHAFIDTVKEVLGDDEVSQNLDLTNILITSKDIAHSIAKLTGDGKYLSRFLLNNKGNRLYLPQSLTVKPEDDKWVLDKIYTYRISARTDTALKDIEHRLSFIYKMFSEYNLRRTLTLAIADYLQLPNKDVILPSAENINLNLLLIENTPIDKIASLQPYFNKIFSLGIDNIEDIAYFFLSIMIGKIEFMDKWKKYFTTKIVCPSA